MESGARPLKLIGFSQESPARLLAHHLVTHGIAVTYQREEGEYPHQLLLDDPQQLDEAEQRVKVFLANPSDQRYQQDAWQSASTVTMSPQWQWQPERWWSQTLQAPFTSLITVLCLICYVAEWLSPSGLVLNWLSFRPVDWLQQHHQWWRLLTPTLLHFSLIHIAFNLLWWSMLGRRIEQRFGTTMILLLYLSCGILSNYAQYLASGANFGGLSGVVYGVMGFVWWVGWLRPQWGLMLPRAIVGFMLVWLVLGYADVLWVTMANTAHTVGLISGCVIAWLVCLRARPRSD